MLKDVFSPAVSGTLWESIMSRLKHPPAIFCICSDFPSYQLSFSIFCWGYPCLVLQSTSHSIPSKLTKSQEITWNLTNFSHHPSHHLSHRVWRLHEIRQLDSWWMERGVAPTSIKLAVRQPKALETWGVHPKGNKHGFVDAFFRANSIWKWMRTGGYPNEFQEAFWYPWMEG